MLLLAAQLVLSSDIAQLSAFVQFMNCTLKNVRQTDVISRQPLFVLSPSSMATRFSMTTSRFSRFTQPIIHAVDHPVSLHKVVFANSAARALEIDVSTELQAVEFSERRVMEGVEPSTFIKCKFNTLSAIQGTRDQTTGGAVTARKVSLYFKECMFSGNSATIAGSLAFDGCDVRLDRCDFSGNKAIYECGVALIVNTMLKMEECNFIKNEAEIYVAVMKLVNSTASGEGVVFHENKAPYQSSGCDLDKSTISFTGSQFSKNLLEEEAGGVVHSLRGSTMKLSGCRFDTVIQPRDTVKRPILADEGSVVHTIGCCVDVAEKDFRKGIEGVLRATGATTFGESCNCQPVEVPLGYQLAEREVRVSSTLLTSQFMLTSMVLIATAVVIAMLLSYSDGGSSQWTKLL